MAPELHPTENRGYRELYAATRQVLRHWTRLSERLGDAPGTAELDAGAAEAADLLEALGPVTATRGLYGWPAAQGLGVQIAGIRNGLGDRFLERNQALRMAVVDLQHVTTLLGYLATVAATRGDDELQEFCGRWERKLRRTENAARKAVIASGADPDGALELADPSPLGRVAHGVALAVGTVGEWVDARRGRKG